MSAWRYTKNTFEIQIPEMFFFFFFVGKGSLYSGNAESAPADINVLDTV